LEWVASNRLQTTVRDPGRTRPRPRATQATRDLGRARLRPCEPQAMRNPSRASPRPHWWGELFLSLWSESL